jgi:hypothetical protein
VVQRKVVLSGRYSGASAGCGAAAGVGRPIRQAARVAVNWDAIGAIGEILGAAAVVASLAYLAVQIRQNTRSVRSSSFHAVADSFNQLNSALASDRELARIFRRGSEDLTQLDVDEHTQFTYFALACFRVMESLFYQSAQGTAERSLLAASERTATAFLETPGMRRWWAESQGNFPDEFRAYLNARLEERAA